MDKASHKVDERLYERGTVQMWYIGELRLHSVRLERKKTSIQPVWPLRGTFGAGLAVEPSTG